MGASVGIGKLSNVVFVQEDMLGLADGLPFPEENLYGSSLFTDRVLWGEIWLLDRVVPGRYYAGFVRNGQLFVDRSGSAGREQRRKLKPRENLRPTPIPVGSYKVWLDAWVRFADFKDVYEGDPAFTKDGAYTGNASDAWTPPAPPHRKLWQDIQVRPPGKDGEPREIRLRSRRFHWLYRITRVVETLDQLATSHEHLVAPVTQLRTLADYLRGFLGLMFQSGTNMVHLVDPRDEQARQFQTIQLALADVHALCENFIRYGYGGDGKAMRERRHLNNLAHLLWHIIDTQECADELAAADPVMAEEHRILLSRFGAVFNRVPRTAVAITPSRAGTPYVTESRAWGRDFARRFALPYFNGLASAAGKPIPFRGADARPEKAIKWINGMRRYAISMLNNCSIFIARKELDWRKVATLLQAEDDNLLGHVENLMEKYRGLGRSDYVEKLVKERALLGVDDARLAASEPEYQSLSRQLESIRQDLEKVKRREPEPLLKGLEKSNPKAIYAVQGFEIAVKWLVANAAWNEFQASAGEKLRPGDVWFTDKQLTRLADALFKTADAQGTTLRSLGLANFVKKAATTAVGARADKAFVAALDEKLKPLATWGKGLSAAADIGSAAIYSMDIFGKHTYGDKLLQDYLPEDAVTMYGFHLVTWGGKWLVASGSSLGVFSKLPVAYVLQGLGYVAQFMGEFGEEYTRIGKGEHKHFVDVHRELVDQRNRVHRTLEARGYDAPFYPSELEARVRNSAEKFEWMAVDPKLYRATFPVPD